MQRGSQRYVGQMCSNFLQFCLLLTKHNKKFVSHSFCLWLSWDNLLFKIVRKQTDKNNISEDKNYSHSSGFNSLFLHDGVVFHSGNLGLHNDCFRARVFRVGRCLARAKAIGQETRGKKRRKRCFAGEVFFNSSFIFVYCLSCRTPSFILIYLYNKWNYSRALTYAALLLEHRIICTNDKRDCPMF